MGCDKLSEALSDRYETLAEAWGGAVAGGLDMGEAFEPEESPALVALLEELGKPPAVESAAMLHLASGMLLQVAVAAGVGDEDILADLLLPPPVGDVLGSEYVAEYAPRFVRAASELSGLAILYTSPVDGDDDAGDADDADGTVDVNVDGDDGGALGVLALALVAFALLGD